MRENDILHERSMPPNGERFLPWFHLKCARLWVIRYGLCSPDYEHVVRECLSLQCSPPSVFSSVLLLLWNERDQTQWCVGVDQKCRGWWFPMVCPMAFDSLE